jgi:hypothetical protein
MSPDITVFIYAPGAQLCQNAHLLSLSPMHLIDGEHFVPRPALFPLFFSTSNTGVDSGFRLHSR